MSVQADDARAKVIHCKALDNEQKAKMLLLINTKPDTTLPVFTGVPDFLLGHTLSVHLEGMTAGNNSYCTRNCIIPRHFIDPQMSMTTHCIWSHLYSSAVLIRCKLLYKLCLSIHSALHSTLQPAKC